MEALLRTSLEADLARLQTWLQTLLADDPPPAEITALCLGLVNLNRDRKPTLDMYVSGERHSGDPAERVIGGSWRPRDPYAKSDVLRQVFDIASGDDGRALDTAEYRLGLNYGGLVLRWLATTIHADLMLGGSSKRVLQVGFDEGDWIAVGTLSNKGLAFPKA